MKVAEELYKMHKDSFQKCLILQGNKRQYFSINSEELKFPERIGTSKYYAETNENTNTIVRRCRDLMSLFGYDEKRLDIFVI